MASVELEGVWWGHEDYDQFSKIEWIYGKRHDILSSLGVEISFYNASRKDIKYVTFTLVPYNAVNDVAQDEHNKGIKDAKVTGPIAPDSIASVRFKSLWTSTVITRVEVEKISVDFMDGTSETIAAQDILYIKKTKGCSENRKTCEWLNENEGRRWGWRHPVGKANIHHMDIEDINPRSTFYSNHADEIKKWLENWEKGAEAREAEWLAAEERRAAEVAAKLKAEAKAKKKAEIKRKVTLGIIIGFFAAFLIFSIWITFAGME